MKIISKKLVIPKIHKHNIAKLSEGIGGSNSKEYCKCDDCVALKNRRNKIYGTWYHRLKRWINNKN